MSKKEVERCLKLSVFDLKRLGLLDNPGYTNASFRWGGSSVGYELWIEDRGGLLRLSYTLTNGWTDRKEDIDQQINLTTTSCNLGGYRYWFRCPSCNKRVGCLYGDKRFLCRKCNDLIYRSSLNSNSSFSYFAKMFDYEEKAEKIYKGVRRQKFYNGKPTRRYKRYMKYMQKANQGASKALISMGASTRSEAIDKALRM
jgi:hypothetical protein